MTPKVEEIVTEPQVKVNQEHRKVVRPGEGERLEAFGDCVWNILTSEDTNGQIMLMVDESPAGSGPPLHVHARDDELWIIQSGCYEFHINGESVEAGPGTVVYGPHEIPHTFRVISETPGRSFTLLIPGGFEYFFRRSAQEFATGAPDLHKIFQIGAEHGITFLTPESAAAYSPAQTPKETAKPKIVRPDQGAMIEVFTERARLILSSEDTGGQLVRGDLETPAGLGPPLHVHTREDEIFIIQSGLYEFQVGDEYFEAEPGAVVYGPRHIPHRFRVISETPGRIFGMALPGGFERFFARCAAELGTGDPDPQKFAQIASEYGIYYG